MGVPDYYFRIRFAQARFYKDSGLRRRSYSCDIGSVRYFLGSMERDNERILDELQPCRSPALKVRDDKVNNGIGQDRDDYADNRIKDRILRGGHIA